jgi:AcrR family transcriptional regulator
MTDSVPTSLKEHEAAILDAARDLMAEGGVEAISMRAVADRVGVTATALYHYFQNKQDLVDRVVRSAFERFGAELEDAARREPVGSMARVAALGEAYLRFAVENETYFRVIFRIDVKDPPAMEDLPGGGGYPLLRQCVMDAMGSGAMRLADPDLVGHYLWMLVHGIVTLALSCRLRGCEGCRGDAGEPSPIDLFHAFAPFIRHGLENVDGSDPAK